jgi:hypothetical protein
LNVLLQRALSCWFNLIFLQFDCHSDPGERGAQFMGGIGQQQAVGVNQLLNPRCGAVEAGRQRCYFIMSLDIDAGGQVTAA